MKRWIAVFLVVVLLAGCLPVIGVAASETPAYGDVKTGDWFYDDVTWAAEHGYISGSDQTHFDPNGTATRAVIVAALFRMEREPNVTRAADFTDVKIGQWYHDAVAWASANGIVTGYSDGTFRPEAAVTREQFAAFLYRFVQYKGGGFKGDWSVPLDYADRDEIGDWALEPLSWCVKNGIIAGTTDTTISPKGGAKRCQIAAMLHRLEGAFTEKVTRADLEKAAVASAWAYYYKYLGVQYDSEILTPSLSKYFGGSYRNTEYALPEYGTTDTTIFSVCSDFCLKSWFSGTGIDVLDGPLNSTTTSLWEDSENAGIIVFRWVSENYKFTDRDASKGISAESPYTKSTEEALQLFKDYKKTLRPGDIIVSGGHAILYVGNGYIIDCAGKKYDMETGVDSYENEGALTGLHDVLETMVEKTDPLGKSYGVAAKQDRLTVVRPSNYLCRDDGDGDPGNDVVTDPLYTIPRSSVTREENDGLEICRTADVHPFQSVEAGGTITYSVAVTNHSNDPDYLTYRKRDTAAYAGKTINDLPVTETVPAGTELVKAEGATEKDGTLIWSLSLKPGETKTVSYTCRVTAPRGTRIVNCGGYVGSILSNTLENTVSGKKLTESDLKKLSDFSETEATSWYEAYGIGDCGALELGERIYQNVLGIDLEFPAEKDLFADLFTKYELNVAHGLGYNSAKKFRGWPYILSEEALAGKTELSQMLVRGHWGGKGIYFALPDVCIKEFSNRYLEPGDILLGMNLSGDVGSAAPRRVSSSGAMVYLGNNSYASLQTDGKYKVESSYWAKLRLWQSFLYDAFIVLRPTQAYDDIHTKTFDPASAEKMPAPKKVKPQAPFHAEPLSEENKAKIAALKVEDVGSAKNLKFCLDAYKKAGIDISAELSDASGKALTAAGYMGTSFSTTDKTRRNYICLPTASDASKQYTSAYRMLLPGYYGGSNTYVEDPSAEAPERHLSDLEVGDILALLNWENSHYFTSVYQGNGKFLVCDFAVDGNSVITQRTMDDAAYNSLLQDPQWLAFYVLRPANGYENINQK